MARPRKFKTAEDLERGINAYFDSVDKYNAEHKDDKGYEYKYYTWPNMCLFLNVNNNTIDTWEEKKDIYKGFSEPIKTAELRMAAQLQQLGLRNNQKQTMAIFLSKQKRYGQLTDRPDNDVQKLEIEVKIKGCDDSVLV